MEFVVAASAKCALRARADDVLYDASTISASGEVYKLNSLTQFPGAYAEGRYGFALGNRSGGDLWLQNDVGVILPLKAKHEGLMLSLGGDAIAISMQ